MTDKYDDLDDILDDFEDQDRVFGTQAAPEVPAATEKSTAAPADAKTTPTPAKPAAPTDDLEGLDEEFAKKLALGMKDLTSQLQGDTNAQAELEALMASLGVQSEESKKPANFSDTISQTVNRLNESKQSVGDNLGNGGDDFLEKMLGELQNAAGGNGDMDSLLGTLMEELSSKDILYEPLKEMHDKYPKWILDNQDKITPEELSRYKDQQAIVDDIVKRFEDPKYSDDDKEAREYISKKMAEMQESGAPPTELVGDLAEGSLPGADLFGPGAGAGLGGGPECPVQ